MAANKLTIDCDSICVLFSDDEIERLCGDVGIQRACRLVAEACQAVADAHDLDAVIACETTSGRARGEDEALWSRLAIDLADDVRAHALERA